MKSKDIGLWIYNPTTGFWYLERMCAPDTAQGWLEIFMRDEPSRDFKLSARKPKGKPGDHDGRAA